MGVGLVHLTTCSSRFEAQLLSVRLGADGIVTEVRGYLGPYNPLDRVEVYVEEGAFRVARQLLLPIEADGFADEMPYVRPWYRRRWVRVVGMIDRKSTRLNSSHG